MLSAPRNHLLNCRRDIKEPLRDLSNEQLVLDFFEKSFRQTWTHTGHSPMSIIVMQNSGSFVDKFFRFPLINDT